MKTDEWEKCYPSNWKGLIVPDAISHPAKYSSKLIRRIYEHLQEEGWIKQGDCVIDPFGGVALGAFDAMRLGLRWYGCELESRFVEIGNANIALWNRMYSRMPHWGSAELLQGDSRKLAEILSAGDMCVSSPPYADSVNSKSNGIDLDKIKHPGGPNSQSRTTPNYSAVVSFPPYADVPVSQTHMTSNKRGDKDNPNYRPSWEKKLADGYAETHREYGTTDGQLGAMKSRDESFQAAISSPPFTGSTADGGWQMLGKYAEEGKLTVKQVKGKKDKAYPSWNKERDTSYAPSDENLGNAKETTEGFQAAISSPPYETGGHRKHQMDAYNANGGGQGFTKESHGYGAGDDMGFDVSISSPPFQATTGGVRMTCKDGPLADKALFSRHAAGNMNIGYGDTDGNLGSEPGNDFWLSARVIVEQVYQVLAPGAHAVWVVKDYVKGGKRVPFCDQWRQMCEAVGFTTLHEHHAMLIEHKGTAIDLDGNYKKIIIKRASFFRRLAEKKGSPPIDWECVLCMIKPLENAPTAEKS